MNFNQTNKAALADLLLSGKLTLDNLTEKYKGKQSHKAATIQLLLKHGYAEIYEQDERKTILSVRPTAKAVNSIDVNS
jgi:hypothetical protein